MKCPNCNKELQLIEGKVKIPVQLGEEPKLKQAPSDEKQIGKEINKDYET